MNPGDYKKRILVAVSGLSPAILTETLFALSVSAEEKFIPTEVYLITTLEGKERAENALLKGDKAAFLRMCKEYQLKNIKFDASHIHVICDFNNEPLSDIRKPDDNESAADFIIGIIKGLTADDDASVHVSIAGGRKTMGYYVGYALSLYGRNQDRLSHVLVDSDFEVCQSFYYPTKESVIEINRNGKHVDFSTARVYLAEIPFVRLRSHLPAKAVKNDVLLTGNLSFSTTVKLAQLATLEPRLVIDVEKKTIIANGYEMEWGQSDLFLTFYVWVILQNLEKGERLTRPEITPNLDYADSFLEVLEEVRGNKQDVDRTADGLFDGMDRSFFDDKKTRVNTELQANLGTALASLFEIKTLGKRGNTYFSVPFDESAVKIIMPVRGPL